MIMVNIIIGSHFGGRVSALKLAEKGYKVAVLENDIYHWGKFYASYLVSKGDSACQYTPGIVFDNKETKVSN